MRRTTSFWPGLLAVLAPGAVWAEPEPVAAVSFAPPGGFYAGSVEVRLGAVAQQSTIRYTLDGSEPTGQSPRYDGALRVSSRAGEPRRLADIPTTSAHQTPWRPPAGEVFQATVVRARAFVNGVGGPSVGHTYWVGAEALGDGGRSRYTVAVVSLMVDAEGLFGAERGIYVPGVGPNLHHMARGRQWERTAHMEFYEPDGRRGFALQLGVRLHGFTSRMQPMKALRLYARKQHGTKRIEYPLFAPGEPERFKRLLLRNASQDFRAGLCADVIGQELFRGTLIATQRWRPVVVFLNGEYWGLHHLRDRYDRFHLAYQHDLEAEQIVLLQRNFMVQEGAPGDAEPYRELLRLMADSDLGAADVYAQVSRQLDVAGYADYVIAEVYSANQDWQDNGLNMRQWRRKPTSRPADLSAVGANPWRFLLFDLDAALRPRRLTEGSFARAHEQRLFALLSKSPAWRTYLVNRFADLLNTRLGPTRAAAVVDRVRSTMQPEMAEHIQRWGYPESLADWEATMQERVGFVTERPAALWQHIVEYFALAGTARLTVEVSPTDAGSIRLNTLELAGDELPFTGTYFKGVPVTLEAAPQPGYVLRAWQGETESSGARLVLDLGGDQSVRAVFARVQSSPASRGRGTGLVVAGMLLLCALVGGLWRASKR